MSKTIVTLILTAALGLGAIGCETATGNSALAGGAGGALIGAAIGSHSHRRAGEGALLGGAIGAIGGAIVGNEIDRQDREGRYYGYDRGYDPGPRYEERDYGYRHPRHRHYSRTYYEPRGYYEVRTYRYGRGPRYRYSETYYECD